MNERETHHSDSELIDLIYAALLGEATWQDFIDRLADDLPNGKVAFFFQDAVRHTAGVSLASGVDEEMSLSYINYYAPRNVWLPAISLRPVGSTVVSDKLVPREELIKSEFYNDFLVPNDVLASTGLIVDRDDDCSFMLTTLSANTNVDANIRSAAQLGRLAPHLKRASKHYRRTSIASVATELGASLFDSMDVGLIIVGERNRVKAISDAGQSLLRQNSAVAVSPLGKIRIRSEDAQATLDAMLDRSYQAAKVAHFQWQGTKLTLIRVERDRISLFFEGPTVIVLIDPTWGRARPPDIDQFALQFRLSRAEVRALSGILSGKSVTDIADDAAVSRETVRTQLKSLYAKTGTRGQTDLLRLVHRYGASPSKNLS